MDHENDDWLSDLWSEGAENAWGAQGDPQFHANPQGNNFILDSNVHHAQPYGSSNTPWLDMSNGVASSTQAPQGTRTEAHNHTAHVAAPDHRMDSTSPTRLTQEHMTAPAHNDACSDTTSTPQSVSEPRNLELICSIYRQEGSDNLSLTCSLPGCHGSYGRWHDFLRHYDGVHAVTRKAFWCPKDECDRNNTDGNKPFPRKDKLKAHLRQAHRDGRGS